MTDQNPQQDPPGSPSQPDRPPCRGAGEIAQKLKQLLFRHRKNLLAQALYRQPETCKHNHPTHLQEGEDVFVGDGPPLPRFCAHADQLGLVCDPEYGGEDLAAHCPLWEPIKTPEQIKQDFRNLVAAGPAQVTKAYPDAAALMWVLNSRAEDVLDGDNADAEGPPQEPPSRRFNLLSLLKRDP